MAIEEGRGLLTDEEREELRQRLAQRRLELQHQQKQLRLLQTHSAASQQEGLSGGGGALMSGSEASDVGKSVSTLLGEVLASVREVQLPEPSPTSASQAVEAKSPASPSPVSAVKFARHSSGTQSEIKTLGFRVAKLETKDTLIADKEGEALKRELTHKAMGCLVSAAEVGVSGEKLSNNAATLRAEEGGPSVAAALSEVEKREVMKSPDFREFFESSTKLVERLLGASEMAAAFADYSGAEAASQEGSEEMMSLIGVYGDTRYTPRRPCTDLRASFVFPELILAAYGAPRGGGSNGREPEGCVLLWSLALKQRPEFVFTCQSAVCSALFDKFHPNVVIGGTYGGSLVVWDSRAQSKPVQRSPLSSRGHASPVYCLEMVGTKNANNLVSVDSDGRLCVWTLQMLGQPSDTLDLKRGSREVCVESAAFPEGEVNSLRLGTEDGSLLLASIHGNKAGVAEAFEAHGGAVTSLQFHPAASESDRDLSQLLLSASVDWSVKLWSGSNYAEPLAVFDGAESYVYDAKWHPSNPYFFASANGTGVVDLWNLAGDWMVPAFRTPRPETAPGEFVAKSKLSWSPDGRRLAVGDSKGDLQIWGVSSLVSQPRPEEVARFERRLDLAAPGKCSARRTLRFCEMHAMHFRAKEGEAIEPRSVAGD